MLIAASTPSDSLVCSLCGDLSIIVCIHANVLPVALPVYMSVMWKHVSHCEVALFSFSITRSDLTMDHKRKSTLCPSHLGLLM
jgi:hypothetical protein